MKPTKYYTIEQIRRLTTDGGSHFFDEGTLRFFSSRILADVYSGPGGVYFVTSERHNSSTGSYPRMYTVRRFLTEDYTREDGRVCKRVTIESASEFQKYVTAKTAKRHAARLADDVSKESI